MPLPHGSCVNAKAYLAPVSFLLYGIPIVIGEDTNRCLVAGTLEGRVDAHVK